MPKKPVNSQKGISWREVANILTSITGFITSVLVWLDIAQYSQLGFQNFLWAGIFAAVVVWGIFLYLLYKIKNIAFSIGLAITMVAIVIAGIWWTSAKRAEEERIRAKQEKIIILVATFDGPESVYDLRGEMVQKIRDATENYGDTEIIDSPVLVTKSEGKEKARQLGKENYADIVIWASYRGIENPNITIYIEYLFPAEEFPKQINDSQRFSPEANLDQLQQTVIQKELGADASALIAYIVGQARFAAEDYETARIRFEQALEQNQKSVFFSSEEVLVDIGNCYLFSSQYEKAVEYFTKAIKENPDFARAYSNRGVAYRDLGLHQFAIGDYTYAIKLLPNEGLYYNNRSNAYSALGEKNLALEDSLMAVKLRHDNSYFYFNLGAHYSDLENYTMAIENYSIAINIEPSDFIFYNNRGNAYSKIGEHDLAQKDFTQSIALNPNEARPYANRAKEYQYTYPQLLLSFARRLAIKDYSQAIDIDPSLDYALYHRGLLYSGSGKYQLAIDDFTELIELDPTNYMYYVDRGNAYTGYENYELAVNDFTYAMFLNPSDPLLYNNRGLAYLLWDKKIESDADFAKYKELTGEDVP